MTFSPQLASIRFGAGLSAILPPPPAPEHLIEEVATGIEGEQRFPINGFAAILPLLEDSWQLRRQARRMGDGMDSDALREQARAIRRELSASRAQALIHRMARYMTARYGFRERLVQFWADHFTVRGKNGDLRHAAASFVEDAIAPHIGGRFSAMLRAATTHPMMLHYLDQIQSTGPNARGRRGRNRGLNENLARELLELHTMGVEGTYTQNDVRQLAELLAGLTFRPDGGFQFRPELGEPGHETVLGKNYGAEEPALADIHAFLDDLSIHPDTAQHIARKLATHFVSDAADPLLVDRISARFRETQGDLTACYGAMLDHPSAWVEPTRKIRQPFDFISSSMRALAVDPARITEAKDRDIRTYIAQPMMLMGQPWEAPNGPDGWPEGAADWITPQGLAARLQWAMTVPRVVQPNLPDPRDFVESALGGRAGAALRFAATNAETKWEGVGLILASPEFQRR